MGKQTALLLTDNINKTKQTLSTITVYTAAEVKGPHLQSRINFYTGMDK